MQLNLFKMIIFGIITFIILVLLATYSFMISKDIISDYKVEEKYERFKISSIEEDS